MTDALLVDQDSFHAIQLSNAISIITYLREMMKTLQNVFLPAVALIVIDVPGFLISVRFACKGSNLIRVSANY